MNQLGKGLKGDAKREASSFEVAESHSSTSQVFFYQQTLRACDDSISGQSIPTSPTSPARCEARKHLCPTYFGAPASPAISIFLTCCTEIQGVARRHGSTTSNNQRPKSTKSESNYQIITLCRSGAFAEKDREGRAVMTCSVHITSALNTRGSNLHCQSSWPSDSFSGFRWGGPVKHGQPGPQTAAQRSKRLRVMSTYVWPLSIRDSRGFVYSRY